MPVRTIKKEQRRLAPRLSPRLEPIMPPVLSEADRQEAIEQLAMWMQDRFRIHGLGEGSPYKWDILGEGGRQVYRHVARELLAGAPVVLVDALQRP